jgi:hypothetical protein
LHGSGPSSAVSARAVAPAQDWFAQLEQSVDEDAGDHVDHSNLDGANAVRRDQPPEYQPFDDEVLQAAALAAPSEADVPHYTAHDVQHRISKPPLAIDLPPDNDTYSSAWWRRRRQGMKSKKHRRTAPPLKVLETGDRFFEELDAYKKQ